MAAREADGRREQQRERVSVGCVMRDGAGAGSSSSEAGRAHEGDGGDMGCVGVDGKYIDKLQFCTCTGLGPRGMRVRYCSFRGA